MIIKVENSNKLHGIKLARGTPLISYLLYADNIIIFLKANFQEVTFIKGIFDKYYSW